MIFKVLEFFGIIILVSLMLYILIILLISICKNLKKLLRKWDVRVEFERPNYYAVIPARIRYDDELSPNEKLLYGEITALTNKNGECWATNKYFSNLYNVEIQTVSRWFRALKEKGYISINFQYKGSSKEIDKRIIKINGEPINKNVKTYSQNYEEGINKNVKGASPSSSMMRRQKGMVTT